MSYIRSDIALQINELSDVCESARPGGPSVLERLNVAQTRLESKSMHGKHFFVNDGVEFMRMHFVQLMGSTLSTSK